MGTNELTLHTVRYDEYRKKYEDIKTAVYELKGSKVSGMGLY